MKNRLGMNQIRANPFFRGKHAVTGQIGSGKRKIHPDPGRLTFKV
jgi:hypothetical protein